MPNLFVISGPNGAGKSTAAPLLIGQRLGIAEFVNADIIAAGISAFAPENAAIEAGRIMLRRLHRLADEGKDFAFETTLASRSFAPWIARLRRERSYRFHPAYLRLPSPELWNAIQDGLKTMEKEGEYLVGAEPRLMGIPISEVMEIFTRAGRDALARHKALGQSVAIWRDGRVVVIPPEEIEV